MTSFQAHLKKQYNRFVMGVVLWVGLSTVLLSQSALASPSFSPLSGLIVQTHLAEESMHYSEALANGKPTLIEFYADWCSSCQAFAPTLQHVHEDLGEQVNFVMLNIDDPQWQEPIQTYHATGVPQLTLLNGDESLAETWVGKVPERYLLQQLKSRLS